MTAALLPQWFHVSVPTARWVKSGLNFPVKPKKSRYMGEFSQKTNEVRPQSRSSRSAVQQAIIDCSDYIKMAQKPRKIKVFRGFLMPKIADTVCPDLKGFGMI